jgi:RHS repeat-associated protein
LRYYGFDQKGSVLSVFEEGDAAYLPYTPYGECSALEGSSHRPGYNGERFDARGHAYHLGKGYRAYHPGLMRFNRPDSLSPFGAGGINPYAYCEGDPVNNSDPSGHLSGKTWGMIAGVVALGVISAMVGSTGAFYAFRAGYKITGVLSAASGVLGLAGSAFSAAAIGVGSEAESFTVETKDGPVTYDNGKASTAKTLSHVALGFYGLAALTTVAGVGTRLSPKFRSATVPLEGGGTTNMVDTHPDVVTPPETQTAGGGASRHGINSSSIVETSPQASSQRQSTGNFAVHDIPVPSRIDIDREHELVLTGATRTPFGARLTPQYVSQRRRARFLDV